MSRSGYSDDVDDYLQLGCYRGQVDSATRGKRGQQFFKDLLAAMDAMPEKRLAADALETKQGEFCALGVLGRARGISMDNMDGISTHDLGNTFGIARQLAAEVVYMDDEGTFDRETPEARWIRTQKWVVGCIAYGERQALKRVIEKAA